MEYIRDEVFKVEPSQICGRRPGTKLVRFVTVCLDSSFYHFQFFKSCLSQILLRPFLNAVSFFNYFIQSRYFYAYLMVADLTGISVHCQVSVRFQYLVSLLSLCWIIGVYSVYRPIEGLLPATGIELTLSRNSVSKVAGLQVHSTTSIFVVYAIGIFRVETGVLHRCFAAQFFNVKMMVKLYNAPKIL